MGKSTPAQFAAKMRQLPQDLQRAQKQGVQSAALTMTTRIRKNLREIVPDNHLSGAQSMRARRGGGGKGAKLAVGYNVRETDGRVTALISARGPWPLIESDTPARSIPKQATVRLRKDGSAARSRFKKRRALAIPGVGVRASAQHPGTTGQKPFARGREATERKVPAEIQKAVRVTLQKKFR